jgi:hypothetical protein
MNGTKQKSRSALSPCPDLTGLGTLNLSGTLFLICDEEFYEHSVFQSEQPLTQTTLITGFSIVCFLSLVILCSGIMKRRRSYVRVENPV